MTWTHTGTVELPYIVGDEQDDRFCHFQEKLSRSCDGGLWIGEHFLFGKDGQRLQQPGRLLLETVKPIESEVSHEQPA